jgi:hypothetical protein
MTQPALRAGKVGWWCLLSSALLLHIASMHGQNCMQWVRRTDVGTPGQRTFLGLAYDSDRGVTVFFGGEIGESGSESYYNDTWEYDGSQWLRINIAGDSPDVRSGHAMCYDSVRKKVLLMGGVNHQQYFRDTWSYHSTGPGTGIWGREADLPDLLLPGPRAGHKMVFDSVRGQAVLSGGTVVDAGHIFTSPEVWLNDGINWIPGPHLVYGLGGVSPHGGLARHGMAFDSWQGVVQIFGGAHENDNPASYVSGFEGNDTNELLELVNGAWNYDLRYDAVFFGELPGETSFPVEPVQQHALAFDSHRGRTVVFGGTTDQKGVALDNNYFEFAPSGNATYPVAAVLVDTGLPAPAPRAGHALVYDSLRGVTILFGGASGSTRFDDTWELRSKMPPILTQPVPNLTQCLGDTVKMAVEVAPHQPGYRDVSYQWRKDSKEIPGATLPSLIISNALPADSGLYDVQIHDVCGNFTNTTPCGLVVNTPPILTGVAPSSLALCPGASGSLIAGYTSPLPVAIQWSLNDVPLPGQTNGELHFVSTSTNQSGLYSISLKNDCGSVSSPAVPVSVGVWVRSQPPPTNSAILCQPNMLSVQARGKGALTAQWLRNANRITPDARVMSTAEVQSNGDTLFRLHFAESEYQDDATYTALITDECVSASAGPFTVRVIPNPPWVRVATDGPAPRDHAAMCYDSDRHVMVLFGGSTTPNSPLSASGFFGDTWEFDGTNWTQRLPVNSPGPRTFANLTYDSWRHVAGCQLSFPDLLRLTPW